MKTGLKLTPEQEKSWPALEMALREQAAARAKRMAEWREKAKEPREHRSVIEGLQERAKRLSARSTEMENLPRPQSPSTTVSMMHKNAASGHFFTWPLGNIGVTDTKAFVTARTSTGKTTPSMGIDKAGKISAFILTAGAIKPYA
jgi:hypothetical protein